MVWSGSHGDAETRRLSSIGKIMGVKIIFLVKHCLFPIDTHSLNVLAQGILFYGLKSFDIEVIREREFVEFGRDGLDSEARTVGGR